jgi:hypothetical protein
MSRIQLKAFFTFCRVKVMEQVVDTVEKLVTIRIQPTVSSLFCKFSSGLYSQRFS